MRRLPKIGLLPLYLSLYDEINPALRHDFSPFLDEVTERLRRERIEVTTSEICCVDAQCRQALEAFRAAKVDLIVTLHLAYSPSEEALPSLCASQLPLLLLDTSMDESFGCNVDPGRIMYNHGIHGVQDLAALLRRWRRPYHIVAGHVEAPGLMGRVADHARAALAANEMRNGRVLRFGDAFKGMGDFAVPSELLAQRFGIQVDACDVNRIGEHVAEVTAEEIEAELHNDRELYHVEAPEEVHRRSVRVGLALRKCLEARQASAFSMNFQAFTSDEPPVDTVPFLEASKAMARGMGYAGEGDMLTASLIGALCRGFGMTTFTEIFCADWRGNSLFLSHMGEINPEVIPGKPLLFEKEYPFSGAANPAVISGSPGPGPAVLVNLSPGPDASLRLILAPVEVLPDLSDAALRQTIRGWIRAALPVEEFLESYSRLGGTHHSGLVLGKRLEGLQAMAEHLGLECRTLGE